MARGRLVLFVLGGFVAVVLAAAILATYAFTACCGNEGDKRYAGPPPMTAVIVDQLSVTSPDEGFVSAATQTLRAAGYAVDYVPGEDVTVDYYRELPAKGYGLVLVRAHSGFVLRDGDDAGEPDEPFIFSSEPYDEDAHTSDQDDRRLSVAYYLDTSLGEVEGDPDELLERYKDQPRYFGIKPAFVTSSTEGQLPGTIVVLMGCSGLSTDALAEAFIDKGARAVVGWDDLVSAPHTDDATELLLQRLLVDGLPAREAVAQTAAQVGPDPTYGGRLQYYE